MANVEAASECARLACRRPIPPQHGQGRRRRYCNATCRAAAYYEAIHGVRCAVRVGTRSCVAPATGLVVSGAAGHGERIATCESCRPAVDALLRRAGTGETRWEPLAAPSPDQSPPVRPPEGYVAYAERRPYVVVEGLDELVGPAGGVVELPRRLDWSGSPTYDLDNPAILAHLYEVVLREALHVEDLRDWLDGDLLVQLWPQLYVPPKVRRLWEERFPVLARAQAAA